MNIVLGDGENAARLYPRGVAGVAPEIGNRTYFELPRDPRPTLPCVVVSNASSRPTKQGFTITTFTYEVYGNPKHQAAMLAWKLANALNEFSEYVEIPSANVVIVGAGVESLVMVQASEWVKKYAVTGWLMLRNTY